MNKYQEALEKLRKIEQTENTWDENCEVLQELVDKDTPKKPDITVHNGFCPNCHQAFGLERTKEAMIRPYWLSFCPYCGQAIDWSEE
jgi:hypothetical protein